MAEWIDRLGRPEDHAEMLAYHWSSALELVRASGGDDDEIVERTRRALRAAGDRAVALNSYAVAAAQYEDALALWPPDATDRPELLFRWARALHNAYDERREDALAQARDELLAAGERDLAAETEAFLGLSRWYRGDGQGTREHLERAEELAGDTVSPSAVRVLAFSARTRAIASETAQARPLAEAALAMAETLDLQELRAHALATVGMTKRDIDDPQGHEDKKRALEIALAIDSPVSSSIANNLAVDAILDGDIALAHEDYLEALRLAERFGDRQSVRFIRQNLAWTDFMAGRWVEALEAVEAVIAECEAGFPHALEYGARSIRGSIRAARGEGDGALADHLRSVAHARERGDPEQLCGALALCAATLAETGSQDEARELVREVIAITNETHFHGYVVYLGPHVSLLGLRDELHAAVENSPPPLLPAWRNAALLSMEDDLREAAAALAAMGSPTIEAELRLRAGERLATARRHAEAETELREAIEFYGPLGATHYLRRAESALAGAQSESA